MKSYKVKEKPVTRLLKMHNKAAVTAQFKDYIEQTENIAVGALIVLGKSAVSLMHFW